MLNSNHIYAAAEMGHRCRNYCLFACLLVLILSPYAWAQTCEQDCRRECASKVNAFHYR
jgi:hypothetical protein